LISVPIVIYIAAQLDSSWQMNLPRRVRLWWWRSIWTKF